MEQTPGSRASAPFAADEVLDDVEHARRLRENQHFVPFGLPLSEQQLQNPQLAWLSERNNVSVSADVLGEAQWCVGVWWGSTA
jgi:hypothetical protein